MLTVKYDRHGKTVSDFYAIDLVKDAVYKANKFNEDIELHYANEIVADIVRIAIQHKIIDSNSVKLVVNDLYIRLDKEGNYLDNLPFSMSEILVNGSLFNRNIFDNEELIKIVTI
jgi:hypothetical protein